MLHTLTRAAAGWTVVGLVAGLAYREITKFTDYQGATDLSLVHTHTLALGTGAMLVVLALTAVFGLDRDRRLRWYVVVWNLGVALTATGLTVKGLGQIYGWYDASAASAKALAGIAGLGHMLLTAGFVLFFRTLFRALPSQIAEQADPRTVVGAR